MTLEVGIQWNNLAFASKAASESGPNSRDHCALLMDEMIITNGIVYSVSQQKVYGLADLTCHAVKNQIYQDFYKMNPDEVKMEDISGTKSYDSTAAKLNGHSATGLTQVNFYS